MPPERLAEIERQLTLLRMSARVSPHLRQAVEDVEAHIRDLEAQLAAARWQAQVAGRAMDSMVTDHVARLHRIGNLVAEGLNEPLTTATPPSPEVGA